MKRFFPFLFLLTLLGPTIGFFYLQRIESRRLKMEIKKDLLSNWQSKDQLEFEFTSQDVKTLIFHDFEQEFECDGRMYDIIKQYWKNGKLHIRCIEDKKESFFNQKLKELVNKYNGSNPNKKRASILSFLENLFFDQVSQFTNNSIVFKKLRNISSYVGFNYLSALKLTDTPPPRQLLL